MVGDDDDVDADAGDDCRLVERSVFMQKSCLRGRHFVKVTQQKEEKPSGDKTTTTTTTTTTKLTKLKKKKKKKGRTRGGSVNVAIQHLGESG